MFSGASLNVSFNVGLYHAYHITLNATIGGLNGSVGNWPGVNNIPPLILNTNEFYLYFHSDGSVNSWGYRMYVTPLFDKENKKLTEVPGKFLLLFRGVLKSYLLFTICWILCFYCVL